MGFTCKIESYKLCEQLELKYNILLVLAKIILERIIDNSIGTDSIFVSILIRGFDTTNMIHQILSHTVRSTNYMLTHI